MANTQQKNLMMKSEIIRKIDQCAASLGIWPSAFIEQLVERFAMPYTIEKKRAEDFLLKNIETNILSDTSLFSSHQHQDDRLEDAQPPSSPTASKRVKKLSALRGTDNMPLKSHRGKVRGAAFATKRQTRETRSSSC